MENCGIEGLTRDELENMFRGLEEYEIDRLEEEETAESVRVLAVANVLVLDDMSEAQGFASVDGALAHINSEIDGSTGIDLDELRLYKKDGLGAWQQVPLVNKVVLDE